MTIIQPNRPRLSSLKVGDSIARWTIAEPPFHVKKGKAGKMLFAVCVCSCGQVRTVGLSSALGGRHSSCGCSRLGSGKHGMTETALYAKWSSMLSRCRNPNQKAYKNYGGRGINVCESWLSFENFRDWALATGYSDGLSLERVDVNDGYEPGNCSWIPLKEQARNKTTSLFVTAWGETKIATDWATDERCKVSYPTLLYRLRVWEDTEKAISKPAQLGSGRRAGVAPSVLVVFGETKTFSQWARDPRCAVTEQVLRLRITQCSFPPEYALTQPPLVVRKGKNVGNKPANVP